MRAVAVDGFGPDWRLRDLPIPAPVAGELLVRVHAAGVNPADWKIALGAMANLEAHRFPLVLGLDGSGVVVSTGPDQTTAWSPGDTVFGLFRNLPAGSGSYAEFTVAPAVRVTRLPNHLDHVRAAALPTPGVTALDLLDAAQVDAGETVVVIGAAGGVGSFATQLAVARGATVIGITRATNREYLLDLGASEVLDYTAVEIGAMLERRYRGGVDALIDLVGDSDQVASVAARLRRGGFAVSAARGIRADMLESRGLLGGNVRMNVTRERLDELARHAGAGMRIPLSRVLPLDRVADALEASRGGHVRGRVVLMIDG